MGLFRFTVLMAITVLGLACNKSGFAPQFGSPNDYLFLATSKVCVTAINEKTGSLSTLSTSGTVCSPFCSGLATDNSRNLILVYDTSHLYLLSFDPRSGAVSVLSTVNVVPLSLSVISSMGVVMVPTLTYVHVYNYSGQSLVEVFGSPFVAGGSAPTLTDPLQRYAYQIGASGFVMSFGFGGVLSAPTTTAGTSANSISSYGIQALFDYTGQYVFTGDGVKIYTYSVNPVSGLLTAGPNYTPPGNQSALMIDKVDKFLVDYDSGTPQIFLYRINNYGASLTLVNTTNPNVNSSNQAAMDIAPSGLYFYNQDNTTPTAVDISSIDQNSGNFTALPSYTPPISCVGLIRSATFYK